MIIHPARRQRTPELTDCHSIDHPALPSPLLRLPGGAAQVSSADQIQRSISGYTPDKSVTC